MNQYKVSFERFRDWWSQEEWLRAHSLVAVAAGSYDGTSGLQHDSGFKAVRIEIEKFAHIIFSGKSKDRLFWLGKGPLSADEVSDIYAGPKPCLHGSDAHEESRLFRPDQDRFCWIKADPTFDGLRQTLFEPDERVFIGIEPPERHNSDSVISGLRIRNTCGWFSTDSIGVNPGFVAIIGSKGSGKTALANLLAAAAGADVDPEDSFLSRASDHLAGLTADLKWVSGRVSNLRLPLDEEFWSCYQKRSRMRGTKTKPKERLERAR